MTFLEVIFLIIIVLMIIPTLIGLDEMWKSRKLAKWYEKQDRFNHIIDDLSKRSTPDHY